jgi:hypothetical protein
MTTQASKHKGAAIRAPTINFRAIIESTSCEPPELAASFFFYSRRAAGTGPF